MKYLVKITGKHLGRSLSLACRRETPWPVGAKETPA